MPHQTAPEEHAVSPHGSWEHRALAHVQSGATGASAAEDRRRALARALKIDADALKTDMDELHIDMCSRASKLKKRADELLNERLDELLSA